MNKNFLTPLAVAAVVAAGYVGYGVYGSQPEDDVLLLENVEALARGDYGPNATKSKKKEEYTHAVYRREFDSEKQKWVDVLDYYDVEVVCEGTGVIECSEGNYRDYPGEI